MEGWTLPEGWEWKDLGDIVEIHDHKRIPIMEQDRIAGNIPYCGANGIIDYVDGFTHDGEFVLLAEDGGKFKAFEKSAYMMSGKFWANNHVHILRGIENLLISKYLYFVLFHSDLTPYLTGATRPKLTQSAMKRIKVPLPYPDDPARSLAEQRRIVARLEALLGEVKAMRERAQTLQCDVNRLMESALAEVFPEINATFDTKHWTFVPVERICTKPQYGYTATSETQPIGPKFLRITDIQDGNVNWDNVPYCRISSKHIVNYLLSDGDILFARSGATTGKTYIVKNSPLAVFASYLIRIRVTEPNLPEYVYWYFQSPQYWKQLTIRGGAQPNMNAQLLRKVLIPIPDPLDENNSLVEQRRIVAYLDDIQQAVREAQELIQADLRAIEQLEQSILAAAFRGEL